MLWNGTIVTASATENPDLFFALRAGGPFYAIVLEWWVHECGMVGP